MPPSPKSIESIQYNLFTSFLGNPEDLSNTIEFWDAIPKYAISARKQSKMRNAEGRLEVYECTFQHRAMPKRNNSAYIYSLIISPARVKTDQGWLDFYPSADEELIEEVLRKIHTDQQLGVHDPNKIDSWVHFSLGMIQKELRVRGKARSINEIKQSISILTKTNIEIKRIGVKFAKTYEYTPLSDVCKVERADYIDDPKTLWTARLPLLYAMAINSIAYRQYNYRLHMKLQSSLSRWLHKRLAHEFINADLMTPYKINYSTIERDSQMLNHVRRSKNMETVITALNALKDQQILLEWNEHQKRVGKKIVDVNYTLIAHSDFIKEVKAANRRRNDAQQTLLAYGHRSEGTDQFIEVANRKEAYRKAKAFDKAQEKLRRQSVAQAETFADAKEFGSKPDIENETQLSLMDGRNNEE